MTSTSKRSTPRPHPAAAVLPLFAVLVLLGDGAAVLVVTALVVTASA